MADHAETVGSIILVGSPNVGKTTIFRKLCKKNIQLVIPKDSSVELSYGNVLLNGRSYKVIDIPGISSLFANSEEELIVRELILHEKNNFIVQVIDAKNLKRDLILSCELIELGKPMILVLNMMDEALLKGIIIDEKAIRDMLGIDVVLTIGNEGEGIHELKKHLIYPRISENLITYPDYIENGIARIQDLPHSNGYLNRAFALQLLVKNSSMYEFITKKHLKENELLQVDRIIESEIKTNNNNLELDIIQQRVLKAIEIEDSSIKYLPVKKSSLLEKFGNYSYTTLSGIPILLSIMTLLYLFVGKFGAEFLADFIQFNILQSYLVPCAETILKVIPSQFVYDAFLGTYGMISMGLVAGIGIVFPIICTFFFAFSILEDSGYLSRVGILLNAIFNKMGLNGKAALPLFLGFSCVTMASLSTRALDTKKERIITILLLWLCVPCSAQLSIYAAILASISFSAVLIIIGVIAFQLIFVGFLAGMLIPGDKSELFMEIHPIRMPNIKYTLSKTVSRLRCFLKEVIPLFLVASFALFILDEMKILKYIELAGKPLVTGLLGLPPRITEVFMIGFIRREAGAAFFKTIADTEHLSEIQIIVALVVMTLFVPCFTSILLVVKEYGMKIACGISAFVIGYALIIGIVLNKVLNLVYR